MGTLGDAAFYNALNHSFLGLFVGIEWRKRIMECTSKDSASADALLRLNSRERRISRHDYFPDSSEGLLGRNNTSSQLHLRCFTAFSA
jgi:hypothetical protein